MHIRIVHWLAPLPFCAGCFNPGQPLPDDDDGAAAESSGEGTTGGSMSTTATSGPPPTDTTGDDAPPSTTETPSDETTPTSADDTTAGDDPFCGDGVMDDGEECDAGEANAFESQCRPDCTLNTCGDGYVWEGVEGCDDGDDDNILEVGACAPDCSRVIVEKVIRSGDLLTDGDFSNNPVAFADGTCMPGFKAMFAVPGIREASASPYEGDGQLDWVLQPFTAYTTPQGSLIWITDGSGLLGVRDGSAEELLMHPAFAVQDTRAITGMNSNWTALNSNTCNGWTSALEEQSARYGEPLSTTEYLSTDTTDCTNWSWSIGPLQPIIEITFFYCVEQ